MSDDTINRGTGLLLIEVINSNPNGDPDRDSDPRIRQDGKGEISPVSFKRKLRDIVMNKESPVWQDIKNELKLPEGSFDILESRETKRDEVKRLPVDKLLARYWDARIFGTTFLEEKSAETSSFIKTGVVQFGLGVSLDPIKIERMTTTKSMPVEADKSRGMAPLAFRVVMYGLYAMPFFINATAAKQTKCTKKDIDLLLRLVPHAYTQTASYIRPQVNIRHAFYVEHGKARGTFNDFKMIESLTPKKIVNDGHAATSWNDYDGVALQEKIKQLNEEMKGKASNVVDLMECL